MMVFTYEGLSRKKKKLNVVEIKTVNKGRRKKRDKRINRKKSGGLV